MNFEDMKSGARQFKDYIHHHSLLSEFAAEFQGFATPSHLKVYCTTRICIIIGVCENVCRMVLESLQFITKRNYHSYPIPRCNSKSAIGQGHNNYTSCKAVGGKQ